MMAAGVAHELNNPLAFVTLAADMLAKRVKPEDAGLVAEVRAGIDRIAGIVRDLRFFGRGDDEPLGPIDVVAAIRSAERLVAHEFRPRGRLSLETGELPAVTGVARHLEQVFVNLFLNAAHAMADENEGLVVVRARVTPEQVIVTVEDNGKGIPAESLESIFDPFFTSRPQGGGMGLGLSISRDLLQRAGGSLTARSTVGDGTTMELTLPRARDVMATIPAAPPVPAEATARGERPRVLVIDDEPLIVQSLARTLGDEVTVVGESDPIRALDRLLSDEDFDAIVCDVMMPGLTGVDLHERVVRHRPERASRFVFITGGTYTAHAREYLGRVPNTRLSKPFDTPEILAAIQRAANAAPVPREAERPPPEAKLGR
jgi:CheY-like chemotaxis protein/two-component sensor histidine kinase